jgi:Leucine-rich repeat (LRR) protein
MQGKLMGSIFCKCNSDLSFNEIEKIEGLETLTGLVDLSFYNNKIQKLENMEALEDLVSLSLGNNLLKELEEVYHCLPCISKNESIPLSV